MNRSATSGGAARAPSDHRVYGLHHITAIAGPPQENLDFYSGVLGMRLVKRSVNQDDPGTYHLFYADAEGHPGADLTFFPWSELAPPKIGHGLAVEVGLEIPPGSAGYWSSRLAKHGAALGEGEMRFGERVLPLVDPHGLRLALIESAAPRIGFTAWSESPVPAEHQIRGLFGARILERETAPTEALLTQVLGFERLADEDGWTRYGFQDSAGVLDLRPAPEAPRGRWGVGSVHHLAWRVLDEDHQLRMRARLGEAGRRATPVIDRFWFKSVYFNEPGGVLFELATDGPGFGVDEERAHLGERLVLPPWLEPSRDRIEAILPPLHVQSEPRFKT
jgi:glyoxalase family protein